MCGTPLFLLRAHTRSDFASARRWGGGRNVGEAAKYGIYFDDTEYDYTQHLKVIGEDPSAVFIPAKEAGAAKRSARNNVRGPGGCGEPVHRGQS